MTRVAVNADLWRRIWSRSEFEDIHADAEGLCRIIVSIQKSTKAGRQHANS